MKIALINTFERSGGAAVACNRLMAALKKQGLEVTLVVRDKTTDYADVVTVNTSYFKRKLNFLRFAWERFVIFSKNKFCKTNLFAVSIANTGNNISKLPAILEADIIHIHWINQGFLSLNDIQRLINTGKPIVWTMHDMWAFTGICHYAGNCLNYKQECMACPLLKNSAGKDLSTIVFNKKKKLYQRANITLVGCSSWIKNCAQQSALLLKSISTTNIPNPIDTNIFCVQPKADCRAKLGLPLDKKLILFGAIKVTDERKGASYMIEACELLAQKYPELQNELAIVVFGKNTEELKNLLPFPVYCLNYISGTQNLVALYNSADIFVVPSLEDNLPNTIMEALACGTPCVGFKSGGIPEMIEHKQNGYIADYKSAGDLAKGMYWCLFETENNILSINACKKVVETYSEDIVSKQYIELYKNILCQKKN